MTHLTSLSDGILCGLIAGLAGVVYYEVMWFLEHGWTP